MKKINIFQIVLFSLLFPIGLSSCLFQDDIPGTENTGGKIEGESVIHQGNADSISFRKEITEQALTAGLDSLNKKMTLGQMVTAQFALRGGKNGEVPGPHAYQYQFSLEVDNYAGYMCLPQNFSGRMLSTYYDSQDFNGGPYGSFLQVKNAIVPVLNHPQIDSIPEIKAIALLIYDLAAVEVADCYGPIPFSNFKENKQSAPFIYETMEKIYKTTVSNIDTIVACLKHFENRPDWYKNKVKSTLEQYDVISSFENRDITNWIKFANSVKLRMAMHIVKVDPSSAKKWAEEAVASGVIENETQQFSLKPLMLGFTNPITTISNLWNDTRLNASFESIMKSLEHPYLSFVFDKNDNRIVNKFEPSKFLEKDSKIVGLRSGIRMKEGQAYTTNFRTAYSRVNQQNISISPLYLMKYSEVLFLRAEGALRGWNMRGTAQGFYEKGIASAYLGEDFDKIFQDKLSEYKSLKKAKKFTYEDPYNERYNLPSVTKIGVVWNNGDDHETKLEKIITQKYIANFPNSFEAWVDLRRTGYPHIFPVLHDDGDGSIPVGDIIRRIPFPGDNDPAVQADIASTGLNALGGADLQGTRLWWDIAKSNF